MSKNETTEQATDKRTTCPKCRRLIRVINETSTQFLIAPHGFKRSGGFQSSYGCNTIVAKIGGAE